MQDGVCVSRAIEDLGRWSISMLKYCMQFAACTWPSKLFITEIAMIKSQLIDAFTIKNVTMHLS